MSSLFLVPPLLGRKDHDHRDAILVSGVQRNRTRHRAVSDTTYDRALDLPTRYIPPGRQESASGAPVRARANSLHEGRRPPKRRVDAGNDWRRMRRREELGLTAEPPTLR
jgi:hypothetical protein